MNDTGLVLARVLIAPMFLVSGYGALINIAGTASYFESLGFPLPTLVAIGTGVFELVMGLVLVAGYQTRLVAAVLAAFCLVATYMGHWGQTTDVFTHQQMLLKDVAVAGGLLLVALFGGGLVSVDALLARRNRVPPPAANP